MPAYQVAIVTLTDRTPGLMEYVRQVAPLMAAKGAKYVIRGPANSIQEGDALQGRSVIVTEWPSLEIAEAFYNSAEYQALIVLREGSGIYDIGTFAAAS